MTTLGDTVRAHRLRACLGLREAARLLECSPGYLSRLETGHEARVSTAMLDAVADLVELNSEERDRLYQLAEKIPPEVEAAVLASTSMMRRIREGDL